MTTAATDKPRRFYKAVSIALVEGQFVVRLDERSLKTPEGSLLTLPAEALAQAVAVEWEAQAPHIDTSAMPLTRLAFTAQDRGSITRPGSKGRPSRRSGRTPPPVRRG